MSNTEKHLPEIQSRMDSEEWNRKIANSVTIKYEKVQYRNKIILSIVSIALISLFSFFGFYSENEFSNSMFTEMDSFRIFLLEDIFTLNETFYEEEAFSYLIDPISFFR